MNDNEQEIKKEGKEVAPEVPKTDTPDIVDPTEEDTSINEDAGL